MGAVVKAWQLERESLRFRFRRPETEIKTAPQNQKLGSEVRRSRTSKGLWLIWDGFVVCFFGPKCIQGAWFG